MMSSIKESNLRCQQVSPFRLYPTETLESISNSTIQFYLECIKDKVEIDPIRIIVFDNNFYIVDGHHKVLASILSKCNTVKVQVVDRLTVSAYKEIDNFKNTLSIVGKRTLYDFEAVGNFSYSEYPEYYI